MVQIAAHVRLHSLLKPTAKLALHWRKLSPVYFPSWVYFLKMVFGTGNQIGFI
jgi:hypothetical protein